MTEPRPDEVADEKEAYYQAGRAKGHQEAVEALSHLVAEDLCRCIGCLDEALEALRG